MNRQASQEMRPEDMGVWRRRIREHTFANFHLKMGQALFKQGETVAAVNAFQRAIEIDPQLIEAAVLLEDALLALGQSEKAAVAMAEIRRSIPNYRTLAVQRLAVQFLDEGDSAAASSLLERAIAAGVARDDVTLELGLIAARQNDADSAIPLLLHGLACREEETPAWFYGQMRLGRILFEQGRHDLAVKHFDKIPDIAGWGLGDAMCAAYSLLVLERLERSADLMDQLILWHPQNIQPRIHAGFAAIARGRYADALQHFQAVLQHQPGHPEALSGTMLAHVAAGDAAAALDSEMLASVGDYPHASSCRGLALQRLGRAGEAIPFHRHACKAAPSTSIFHADLGLALEASGDTTGAQDAFRMAAGLGPDSLWLWFWAKCRPWATEHLVDCFRELGVPRLDQD